ncbi:MAG: SAM-dependent methyltransferase [Bacteroidales bacterium]|nr:SAM-dependent methyltransferase [Bacteroidales bacterium]
MPGRLILFPVPIGAEDVEASLPAYNLQLLNGCHTFIVEELRTARRFLKHVGYQQSIDETTFHILNEHTEPAEIGHYLDPIDKGEDVGLLSEAGLPCVADPGALVTRMAQSKCVEIVPLVGPSSLMLALMASGLNGQQFAFLGYLPVDRHQRAAAIRSIEQTAIRTGQTQIFIEAPYRNNQMLEALSDTCHPETLICVACDLTLASQTVRALTAAQWRKQRQNINLHKRNTVFLVGV